jgi:transposase
MTEEGRVADVGNIEAVVARLRELAEQGRHEELLQLVLELLVQMRDENSALKLRLAKVLKQQFGRKSERVDSAQLTLLLEALAPADRSRLEAETAAEMAAAAEPALPTPKTKVRPGHGRRPLPADLPRQVIHVPVEEEERDCPLCGRARVCIGHLISEMIEFVPASFRVLRFEREKLACPPCGEGVAIGPAPDRVIDSGLPGPGLLAHVVLSKYVDHLPLHRLARIYARSGVHFAVSTLADWVGGGAEALTPIARRILEHALASEVLQTDDTGLRVLDRDHPNGSKRGHMWGYIGDGRWVAFDYTPDWSAERPREVLSRYKRGHLMHDGYAGYSAVHTANEAIIELACWAHARRGFIDTLEAGDGRAAVPIKLIAALYEVESRATAANVSVEERTALRGRESRPICERLHGWLVDTCGHEPPKSPLAQASAYALKRWTALTRCLDNGALPLDNNASERALRGICVGRKNYLFAGSDTGAERAAVLYTVVGTCALNGVEPWAYLRDVLAKLSSGWKASRIDELLPSAWAANHQAQKPESAATTAGVADEGVEHAVSMPETAASGQM